MKNTFVKMIFIGILCLGVIRVVININQQTSLKSEEISSETRDMSNEKKLMDYPISPLASQVTSKIRADINEIWPGQDMMEKEYGLIDDNWTEVDVPYNSRESIVTFPIEVEGFENGTLLGHIRFGGVDASNGGIFAQDTGQQLRSLVFVIENTKKFKDKAKTITVKYTYNYRYADNRTYTMVPLTGSTGEFNISQDGNQVFDQPFGGGAAPTNRKVEKLYIQETKNTGQFAVKAKTKKDLTIGNVDFKFQLSKTLIPTTDGNVRIVNEIENTGWKSSVIEGQFPRKKFGIIIGEDTMLNDVDSVPIFSLGKDKGLYIANKEELFRVSFPRVKEGDGAATNYEGQKYGNVFTSSAIDAVFQKQINGYGNEGQDIKLDERVWPANGHKPPLSGSNSDPIDERGYDTMFAQKWTPREPPEKDEKAILTYDVKVLPIYKPEIKLDDDSINQSSHKDKTLTFNGKWRDYDSLNVTLYYKIGSKEKNGWIKFKSDSREDADDQKDKWFPFTLDLPASQFKLNGDTISFKAVDTTKVDSDIVTTEVNTFETVTIKTEHYGPTGVMLDESSFQATPGKPYTTTSNDYTNQGLTLDSTKTEGITSGETPNKNVLVKYYYKEGIVKVISNYLKEDDTTLFAPVEKFYKYNQTYTTDERKAEANEKDYYLDKITGTPTGPTGKIDQTIEVTYHYRIGKRGIIEATSTLDLGMNNLISLGTKDVYPTTDTKLTILDELSGNWELELRISDEIKSGSSPLKGSLYFQTKKNGLKELNKEGQAIHSREDLRAGEFDLTWEKDAKEGLFLREQVGNQKGAYKGTIEWNIVSAP